MRFGSKKSIKEKLTSRMFGSSVVVTLESGLLSFGKGFSVFVLTLSYARSEKPTPPQLRRSSAGAT